jgi:hypothetical protein
MKTLSILTFATIIFLSVIFGIYKESVSVNFSFNELQFQKRIDVYTRDKNGNILSNALVRVTGPSYEMCCFTDSITGKCIFLVNNNGTHRICASKNNSYNDTTIVVNDCQLSYPIELRLTKTGACINCDQEHIIR